MCDTYIGEVGYVCQDCIIEFKDNVGNEELTRGEIKTKLVEFMDTSKRDPSDKNQVDIDDFFDEYRR